jgi:hypothetical protein
VHTIDTMFSLAFLTMSISAPRATEKPESLAETLRRNLAAYAVGEGDEAALRVCREALRPACEEARHAGVRVESVLLTLKREWWQLPEARRLHLNGSNEALSRVVTACIQEYYADTK